MLNPNLLDYAIPTALDVPNIQTVMVEDPCEHGPYGGKGVGGAPNHSGGRGGGKRDLRRGGREGPGTPHDAGAGGGGAAGSRQLTAKGG